MGNKIALVNGQIYNGDDSFIGQALLINGEVIQGIFPKHAIPADYRQIDVQQGVICPGLIDLQIYGTGEDLFSAELTSESLLSIDQQLLKQGCTSYLLTLATNTLAVFKEAIAVYRTSGSPMALGLHLEGPFLNVLKRGAHPAELIVEANVTDINDLLAEAGDAVKMMTVAPELLSDACLTLLLEKGVLLSAGHSAATFDEAIRGFDQGIKATTHLWNAMSGLHHREVGLPGAAFAHMDVMASVIVDGIHVDFEAVRLSKQLLGRRLFLITDAVGACEKGIYQHIKQKDHFTLPNGTLSGSALTMLQAIRNCVEKVHIPMDEAIRMATQYPAELIGRSDIGNLNVGSLANILVFNADYEVQSVYLEGELVD
ncbi:N-acetylglucosamine-6-phosphate deacetylase [Sphingobacterium psychroaquaticum]|uniref:N-acetylglucosamine-6-phosphate deacetylase n=1 Tax=Sphingobacterium psychroaquaticum TaxID=561061 RepID=A0A1X7L0E8_9SPHI|nr:N-acetylglucosamine-6-phosphate deacetylase [Sphingobacterium psychroaquaticum]SMG46762.1 N-acetylglucosamine-6-phosphate deacetylase [Sphingobacterium psychroaquaticum]